MASQVHIIFLYHPAADSQSSALPDAIVKRVEALYHFGGNNCTIHIAHIRYGFLPSNARNATLVKDDANLVRFLSSSSKLSMTPFITSSNYWAAHQQTSTQKLQQHPSSILINVLDDIKKPHMDPSQNSLDSLMNPRFEEKPWVGCLADGLVAAIELFTRATPLNAHPLARYLIHLLPDTPPLDMDDRSFPHSNLDSMHDRWSWIKAAQELGKMAVWPSTHVLPSSPGASSNSLTPECEKVHGCILDEMPSTYPSNSDPPSILGGQYKGTSNAQGLLLAGLSDAAASAAKASLGASNMLSRKRVRKLSSDSKSQKEKSGQNDSFTGQTEVGNKLLTDGGTSTNANDLGRNDIDKVALHKIVFLQQQQQMMMRNLAVAARQQQTKGPDQDSPVRQRLLEQFRDQLIAQQAALKSQATILHSGGSVPNLSNSLTTLIAIDKEARDRGLHLGGPSGMQQAMVQRQKQLMHIQQQQQMSSSSLSSSTAAQVANPPNITAAPSTLSNPTPYLLSSLSAPMTGQSISPAGAQPFWNGAIMWTVALANNKRNQAVTFVSAHCAPNTLRDALMLPWQQRLNISEVQSITLASLQSYAAKNSIPCVLFQPLNVPIPARPQTGGAPAPQQTNETMYHMLAKMIDSKKSCAFISLQGENCTPEAGMVLVPTSTQAAGPTNKRLLGLVFKQAVPWQQFSSPLATTSMGQTQGGSNAVPSFPSQQLGQIGQQQAKMEPSNSFLSNSSSLVSSNPLATVLGSAAIPQQALFQPQQPPSDQINATSSISTTSQQMPLWAQPLASATFPTVQAPPSALPSSTTTFPTMPLQAISLPLSDMNTNGNFDLQALGNQFNLNAQQPSLSQEQSQLTQPPAFNTSNFWTNPAQNSNNISMPNNNPAQSTAPLDMDAIQRLLGLNTS